MFISINKKIVYSLLFFLLLLIAIFSTVFINFYYNQMLSTKQSVYMRNKYVVSLLQENVMLQNELANMGKIYPELPLQINLKNIDDTQKQLSHELRLNEELRRTYSDNREAVKTGAKIVLISLGVVIIFIILLFILLDHWIIRPIERLTTISNKVSQGDYSSRIKLPKSPLLHDEFSILNNAFNTMIEKTENNIADIQQREAFLQQLIDAIPNGIRVIDSEGNVIMVNKAFCTLFDCKQNCVGEKCYHAYGSADEMCSQSKYTCPLLYFRQNKNGLLRTIHEVAKKPLYLNAASVHNKEKYIIESFHDLSADIRFSHQQKVSSLGFLSTSIAHEMKNNLGAIRLILEGLLDGELKNVAADNNLKKYLTMAHHQLIEAVKTPERLLHLAQFSDKDNAFIPADSAIKDMLMMIDYDAKRHGIEINTDIEPNIGFEGNEADFKMIILNLLQNAIKAMPQGGKLVVEAAQKKRHIAISIKDTGIGIEPDKLKRIFEPFFSDNSQSKSSGLGLAIVHSLVEKFGGNISVKSKPHYGSTFSLKIPLKK